MADLLGVPLQLLERWLKHWRLKPGDDTERIEETQLFLLSQKRPTSKP
jgi:hypothetical protein